MTYSDQLIAGHRPKTCRSNGCIYVLLLYHLLQHVHIVNNGAMVALRISDRRMRHEQEASQPAAYNCDHNRIALRACATETSSTLIPASRRLPSAVRHSASRRASTKSSRSRQLNQTRLNDAALRKRRLPAKWQDIACLIVLIGNRLRNCEFTCLEPHTQ